MKKNKKINLILLLIIILILAIIFEISNKSLNHTSTILISQSEDISLLSNETINTYNKDIFAFNENSVKLINEGNLIWEDNLDFKNPYSVFNKGILGISEKNGSKLKVYSSSGLIYTVKTDGNIISFSLNQNAYTSIISKQNNYYEINVYNNSGELMLGLKNISYTEGIPISSSISADNKFLAVSFLNIDDINYNSNISLYSLENLQVDETTDNLFAAFLQENQFSGIVEFIGNSYILTISEKKVSFFKIVNNTFSSSLWEIELNNKLKFLKIIDDKNFVLVYGEPISIENAFENNTVVFYNISGEKLGQYTPEKDISNISVGYSSCIIQCNRTLKALNLKGKVIWEYQILQDLKQFYFFENTNKIITSSGSKVSLIEINKKSNKSSLNSIDEDSVDDAINLDNSDDT